MPTKAQCVYSQRTASRMAALTQSTHSLLESLVEDQRHLQDRVDNVETLYTNASQSVASLHRRMDSLEEEAQNQADITQRHKRMLDRMNDNVRDVRQRTETVQTTMDDFVRQAEQTPESMENFPHEPAQTWGRGVRLNFFTMTEQEKEAAREEFYTWLYANRLRQAAMFKRKTQGSYGPYISHHANYPAYYVFSGVDSLYPFSRSFKLYEDSIKYRDAVFDMLKIKLEQNIPTDREGVKNYQIKIQ